VNDQSLTERSTRLWGGRFRGGPAEALARLSVSVQFDWRLAPYDLAASRAHARVLARAGLLSADELGRVLAALDDLEAACASGEFRPSVEDEDVHTALERGLLERLGALGGKLRAGRSRNDQVATDLRLYLRDRVRGVAARLVELADALTEQAQRHVETPAPGMTHLQHAQPVSFGHWLLAHVQALLRDLDRLRDWDARAAISPLGAGALAGSSLPLDPVQVAHVLGFAAAAPLGYALATEVADWLVRRGVPFREAHEITGQLVALCAARDCALDDVSDEDLTSVSPLLTPEVREVLSVPGALAARRTPGSTGPGPVGDQLAVVEDRLDAWRDWAAQRVVPR